MARTAPFSTAVGVNLNTNLAFFAESCIVDNYSNQWVYVPAAARFIPPWQYGVTLVFPSAVQAAQLIYRPAPGTTNPPTVSGQGCDITFTDAALVPANGSSVAPLASGQIHLGTITNGTQTNFPLPAGTYGLGLLLSLAGGAPTATVVGAVSSASYLSAAPLLPPGGPLNDRMLMVPIEIQDTSVNVTINALPGGGQVRVVAIMYPIAVPAQSPIAIMNADGTTGNKFVANSVSVTVASDQSAIPVEGIVTANPSAIAGLTFAAGGAVLTAAASTGSVVAAVGGKTITLYGVKLEVASSNVGYLEADLFDSAVSVRYAVLASRLVSAAGLGGLSSGWLWIPGGVALGIGLGLTWKNASAVAADVTASVYYTQV